MRREPSPLAATTKDADGNKQKKAHNAPDGSATKEGLETTVIPDPQQDTEETSLAAATAGDVSVSASTKPETVDLTDTATLIDDEVHDDEDVAIIPDPGSSKTAKSGPAGKAKAATDRVVPRDVVDLTAEAKPGTSGAVTKASEKAITKLLTSLSLTLHECPAISGASPNSTCSKVELDIAHGERAAVNDFLQRRFPGAYYGNQFELIEQKRATGMYLVGVGEKVANANIGYVRTQLQKPARALDKHYGTVTCLAKDVGDNGQKYVLTSNHVIHYERTENKNRKRDNGYCEGSEGSDRFISAHHNKLYDVSGEFQSVFGPRRFRNADGDEVVYNVDIASLKISPGFTGFADDQCGCAFDDLPPLYCGSDVTLKDVAVQKNGAATGITCGWFFELTFPTTTCMNLGFYNPNWSG